MPRDLHNSLERRATRHPRPHSHAHREAVRPADTRPEDPRREPLRSTAKAAAAEEQQAATSQHETAPPPPSPPPHRRARWRSVAGLVQTVLINPNYAKLWTGQAISSVGDYAWDTALVLWIASVVAKNQSWAPLAVSGVVLAAAVPQIVVAPLAGVFVDRWDRRRTIIIMSALQAILAALLVIPTGYVALPFIGQPHLPAYALLTVTYADVVLITSFAQFSSPAQFALIKDIVAEAKQDQAVETTEAVQGLSVIIGPPLAAALVFGVGVEWALLVNAFSFIIAFLLVFAIRPPRAANGQHAEEHGKFFDEFRAGLGYVTGHTVLRTILVAEVLTWLGFGAMESLGYFFITGNLHAPASNYGLFGADFGIGAIVGALLVTFFGQRIGLARLFWIALSTSGIFVIVMAHLTSFYPALGAAFFFGIATTAIIVSASPLALDATSGEFVGRVMSVINPLGRLAALISVLVSGFLVSTVLQGLNVTVLGIHFGPVDSVFTGMGLLALLGGIYVRVHLQGLLQKQDAAGASMAHEHNSR